MVILNFLLQIIDDPVAYINQTSQEKREKIENGADAVRLKKERVKNGDYPFKDMYVEVNIQAESQMLEDNGVKKGLTQEKLNGTYVRPKHLTEDFLESARKVYVVEFIKKYFDLYPDMFNKEPDLRDKFFESLKGDRMKLRKYPDVVHAMYNGKIDDIPEDLRCDLNT